MNYIKKHITVLLIILFIMPHVNSQEFIEEKAATPWNNTSRLVRYQPDGSDFIIVNGERRFNRALYGTNTGYRTEAGDLPEFAQYLPDMGGNLKFGFITPETSKWLIEADSIIARYKPGCMIYTIKDKLLGNGALTLTILAMAEAEGFIVKMECRSVSDNCKIFWAFGGVSGTNFSRNGDIGADPESSFYLKPEYCIDNIYRLEEDGFTVFYLPRRAKRDLNLEQWRAQSEPKKLEIMKPLKGLYPLSSEVHISDAATQTTPYEFYNSTTNGKPAITGVFPAQNNGSCFFTICNPESAGEINYSILPFLFDKAEEVRKTLAGRIVVNTPDDYINTLGGVLSMAADAIYQEPSYLHGAVAWRMWLNGWRGAGCADALGWHDRAKAHFSGYIQSQVTYPPEGPVIPDTSRHFARQKETMGTSMFSSGYICRNPKGNFRPHHYDMNMVFIDQLLTHYQYTGDTQYIRETWPAIKLHLAWEKRNFDADDDGLYDAYCCIWASDAVQYNGGKVSYSSAYNYRANKMAAKLAEILGKDPRPYREEADKIFRALNMELWIPDAGLFAEYKDVFGLQKAHPFPGVWTIYHTLDEGVADVFQAYQCTRYIDEEIPHIPVIANGLDEGYYTISTSNWMPYTWSVNNVALAEVLHTSLAYWQAGRSDKAFTLWKSALLESMYLGSSPGNFQQLSFYDAMRGELYRDFADPIGMAARTLVEGLFGIKPDALKDTLTIEPGFPGEWDHASLVTPDIIFQYKQDQDKDIYTIIQGFPKQMNLNLILNARKDKVKGLKVNGQPVNWKVCIHSVGNPQIEINYQITEKYIIEIMWEGNIPEPPFKTMQAVNQNSFAKQCENANIVDMYDPQNIFKEAQLKAGRFEAKVNASTGFHTAFLKLKQGSLTWWAPVNIEVVEPICVVMPEKQSTDSLAIQLRNNTGKAIHGKVLINKGNDWQQKADVDAYALTEEIKIPVSCLHHGTNVVIFEGNGFTTEEIYINWDLPQSPDKSYEMIDLSAYFNDKVTQIFQNKYLSPRSPRPTLSTPWQGIGNWCYPLITANIEDKGLRILAGEKNTIQLPQGIPLATPSDTNEPNILFVTQWDNYPDEVIIPLSGKASHAYLMMTGTTNPMQSRFTNGEVIIVYADGSQEVLPLNNPETWWPIEQDYYTDGYAFSIDYPKPYRVHLKTGLITRDFKEYISIKGFSNYAIDGGVATILDIPLDAGKTLQSVTIKAIANEVVIGLMSLTLMK